MAAPPLGKLSRQAFDALIAPHLGAARPGQVLVGPRHGVDVAILRTAPGQVMAVTADPLSLIPELGVEASAWLSAQLLASDVATSGLEPAFAVVDYNLPPQMDDETLARYQQALHRALADLGVAVVGGHTGRYPGCDYTIIGAGVMMATGPEDRWVCSATARPGDACVVTKGAAVAATGILARVFPETARRVLGDEGAREAAAVFGQFGVVKEARLAAALGVRSGGVSAMHDATEGGVLGAIAEMAEASGLGAVVEREAIPVSPVTRELCRAFFGMDPYTALGEGALVLAVDPARAAELQARLGAEGIRAAIVGRFEAPGHGRWVVEPDGRKTLLAPPAADPYWAAYARARESGWR
ncbi:MAG: AIR synthase family protein [Limnochordaceae bacterium]|nr:AIR synthase family protein [Limnochordaceae bacterium]